LIVDDEPYNIEGVRMMLQLLTQQYLAKIDTAGNGLKAVNRVKSVYAQGQSYKLILMGCNMPKMDGYKATQQIH
jgi:CheY-like chemotaxis protein